MTDFVRRVAILVLIAALAACAAPAERAAEPTLPPSARPPGTASPPPASPPPAAAPPAAPPAVTPVVRRGDRRGGRVVALTFDADMTAAQGPRAAAGERFDHPALVDTLRRLRVPSTVFMTGRWAEEYPAQARSMGRDPLFEVANHSYSHFAFTADCYGLPTVAPARMRADVERAFAAFRAVGVRNAVPYFRFPGGCFDARALRAIAPARVTAVQWDVVSGDAFATDARAVARQVLDGVRPGSVVVLHCTRSAAPVTEEAVRAIVPELRRRGYRFVKVSELFGAASS